MLPRTLHYPVSSPFSSPGHCASVPSRARASQPPRLPALTLPAPCSLQSANTPQPAVAALTMTLSPSARTPFTVRCARAHAPLPCPTLAVAVALSPNPDATLLRPTAAADASCARSPERPTVPGRAPAAPCLLLPPPAARAFPLSTIAWVASVAAGTCFLCPNLAAAGHSSGRPGSPAMATAFPSPRTRAGLPTPTAQ